MASCLIPVTSRPTSINSASLTWAEDLVLSLEYCDVRSGFPKLRIHVRILGELDQYCDQNLYGQVSQLSVFSRVCRFRCRCFQFHGKASPANLRSKARRTSRDHFWSNICPSRSCPRSLENISDNFLTTFEARRETA
jgi:hypothetical protein